MLFRSSTSGDSVEQNCAWKRAGGDECKKKQPRAMSFTVRAVNREVNNSLGKTGKGQSPFPTPRHAESGAHKLSATEAEQMM